MIQVLLNIRVEVETKMAFFKKKTILISAEDRKYPPKILRFGLRQLVRQLLPAAGESGELAPALVFSVEGSPSQSPLLLIG